MKRTMITLAAVVALASPTIASAHRHHHRHHHHGGYGSAARTSPNGTAGGPTSLSGTGSSKFGGNSPGAPSATRQ